MPRDLRSAAMMASHYLIAADSQVMNAINSIDGQPKLLTELDQLTQLETTIFHLAEALRKAGEKGEKE